MDELAEAPNGRVKKALRGVDDAASPPSAGRLEARSEGELGAIRVRQARLMQNADG